MDGQNKRWKFLLMALGGLLLMTCLVFALQQERPRRAAAPGGKSIKVAKGGNLQKALDAAQAGDTIILEAGASFTGPFTLPLKAGSDFITIQSSALSQLPPSGSRVSPQHSSLMPKLLSPGDNQPALQTSLGAHHFRFIGVEFAPLNASVYLRELIRLGDGSVAQNSLSLVAHDLILDRCYIHAHPTQAVIRGVALNSASTDILNCYISDFKSKDYDSQAVWGWNGPGPFHITNNYLEASGENVGFGGSDPALANMIPSDIEIKGNLLSKPLAWRGQWMVKNLLELKVGQRVKIEGNVMENCWADAQAGFAIQLTVRNQSGGARWNAIRDVAIKNNIIRHVGSAINLLGRDNEYPSEQLQGLVISNNLFEDVDGVKWGGGGIFMQMTETAGVVVEHNTVLHSGTVISAYGVGNSGFEMSNNVMGHNAYGIFGSNQSPGLASINVYLAGSVIRRNVIAGADAGRYPSDNYYPARLDDVKFFDRANGNYRLDATSPFKSGATDGKDVGCDFDALAAAINGPGQTPVLLSTQLVSSAMASASTLANNTINSQEQISSLATSIAQAYEAFIKEAGQFSSAAQIDSGLRVALYFSRAAAALAIAEGPSSLSVRNRLQIVASQLARVNDLMKVEAAAAKFEAAHLSSANFSTVIGPADTRSSASSTSLLAPGSLGSIIGDPGQSPLAMQTSFAENASSGALPFELAGVSVIIGGRAALLVSVSPSRIAFIVPKDLPSGDAEVIVTLQEGYVSRGMTTIAAVAPGIFTTGGAGSSAGVVLNASTFKTGPFDVTTPESLGTDKRTRLMIFTTGFSNGVTNSNSSNDIKIANTVVANLAEGVTVEARTSSGSVIQLPVEFAGTRSLGIDQVNVLLPASLKGAGAVQLTLVVGDKRSNSTTVMIN